MMEENNSQEDINLTLRQLSAKGKLEEVKSLLKNNPSIDINACGAASGNTALHFAAKNGHFLVVEYLISKGSDIDIKNKATIPQTALDLAAEPKTKMFLAMVKPMREAIEFAQNLLPEEGALLETASSRQDFRNVMDTVSKKNTDTYNNVYSKYVNACKEGVVNILATKTEKEKEEIMSAQQEMLTQYTDYIKKSLLFVISTLDTIKQEKFKQGRCGLRTKAAYAYLVANDHTNYPIEDLTYEMPGVGGHQFLLVGRNCPLGGELGASGYGIFCDPYSGNFYSSRNIPKDTCVQDVIKNPEFIKTYASSVKPAGEGFIIGKDYVEQVITELFGQLKSKVQNLVEEMGLVKDNVHENGEGKRASSR